MKKYICKSELTSQKMSDGKRVTFPAGKEIPEEYINPVHLERYLKKGIVTAVKDETTLFSKKSKKKKDIQKDKDGKEFTDIQVVE